MNKLFPIDSLCKEELKVLLRLFSIKEGDKAKENLTKKLSKLLLPGKGVLQSGLDYPKFIQKIADKNKIELPKKASIYEVESTLMVELFAKSYNEMSKREQEKLLKELSDKGLSKNQLASVTALTTIGAAQLSGFGVYLLASSTVGTISGALGVTLPFAFYTGMSQIISIAIGPVGLLLAAYPIYKSYKGVDSWDSFRERSMQHYKNIIAGGSTLIHGNYILAEAAFNYLAGIRIMKVTKLEKEIAMLKENMVKPGNDSYANAVQLEHLENHLFSLKYPGARRVNKNKMGASPQRY